jgi:hypothetical protein
MTQDKITIYRPKSDGAYIVKFETAAGETLAISVPSGETAVLQHFQARMDWVPEADRPPDERRGLENVKLKLMAAGIVALAVLLVAGTSFRNHATNITPVPTRQVLARREALRSLATLAQSLGLPEILLSPRWKIKIDVVIRCLDLFATERRVRPAFVAATRQYPA